MQMLNTHDHADNKSIKLTPRGAEVFFLTLTGEDDKSIATKMGISYSCVRRHKEKMLMVNNCTTILELISKYYGNTM